MNKQTQTMAGRLDFGGGLLGLMAVCLIAIVAFGRTAMAQSTIFNIPTTDTVATKKAYLEFDYFVQAPKAEGSDRLSLYVPRGVVGLGKNVEAGANLAVVHSGDSNNVFFQPNMKWKFFSGEKGTAASIGGILFTPVNNRKGVDTYGMLYANLSQKIGKYGTRLTVGPYGVVGGSNLFAGQQKVGAIVGFEQPLNAKISVVADWFSCKNGFGYFTPGISINLPHSGLLNAGYSIGNDSYHANVTHNRLVFLYYGVTF